MDLAGTKATRKWRFGSEIADRPGYLVGIRLQVCGTNNAISLENVTSLPNVELHFHWNGLDSKVSQQDDSQLAASLYKARRLDVLGDDLSRFATPFSGDFLEREMQSGFG